MTSRTVINAVDLPSAITGAAPRLATATPETRILPMVELERQTILNTIAQLDGDKLMAARLLGIGKTTLYRKLKEYGAEF